ncbi:MAG: glycosyltransferase family 2 protein [Clostridia bacterium]|nr:glycosyltransferase family 2 protein [Clostridia bacterium]MDD4047277.1 glycosyltransferase family 2 protein [Clostridia bacterium]
MPKITAMMIVRNEAHRYLERCLTSLLDFVDEIIILDDASTDTTPDICLSCPIVKLYRRKSSLFLTNEAQLRQELWFYTTDNKPEWILAIDADEFLETKKLHEFPYLIQQKYFQAISFRLFDCWGSEKYYRVDGIWSPWLRGFSIYAVKYQPQLTSTWPKLNFHCGRLPLSYRQLPHLESELRIKHLGWANPIDIQTKYERAIDRDPTFKYMSREHYESILYPPEKIALEMWM